MFQFTWPLCTPPMFKFGPRGFQNWFYIHCSSNQKKVPSAQTFFAPNRSKLGKWTIQNHCALAIGHWPLATLSVLAPSSKLAN